MHLRKRSLLCLMSDRNRDNEYKRLKGQWTLNSNTSGRRNKNEKIGGQRKKTTQDTIRKENEIQMLHQL